MRNMMSGKSTTIKTCKSMYERYGDYVVNLHNIEQPFEAAINLPPEIFEMLIQQAFPDPECRFLHGSRLNTR